MNRTFHVFKTSVYRFDIYGKYRTLWTLDDNFVVLFRVSMQAEILSLVWSGRSMCSKPHFIDLTYMGGIRSCGPIWPIFNTGLRLIEAYLQSLNSVALCVRTQTWFIRAVGRTDRHSSNILEFCADQMSPRNIGSQIIISRCYKRFDKTNIPSLRRV